MLKIGRKKTLKRSFPLQDLTKFLRIFCYNQNVLSLSICKGGDLALCYIHRYFIFGKLFYGFYYLNLKWNSLKKENENFKTIDSFLLWCCLLLFTLFFAPKTYKTSLKSLSVMY